MKTFLPVTKTIKSFYSSKIGLVVCIFIFLIVSCSKPDNENEKTPTDNSSGFCPLEVGRYWKYKYTYINGVKSTSNPGTEAEVFVQVIAKKSNKEYVMRIIPDECSSYEKTVIANENGNLTDENGKLYLCLDKMQLDPSIYTSFFGIPNLTGGSWTYTGEVKIKKTDDEISVEYSANELYVPQNVAANGNCKQKYFEMFKKGIGLISCSYIINKTIASYSISAHDYIYTNSLIERDYTMSETGVSDVSNPTASLYWRKLGCIPFGAQTQYGISFTINKAAYIGTGGNIIYSNTIYKYTPSLDTWDTISPLPSEARTRKYAIGFSLNGKGYICGGQPEFSTGSALRDFWQYNPETDQWLKRSPFPLPGGIAYGTGFSIGGKAYVGLGFTAYTNAWQPSDANRFFEYNPETDTWKEIKSFPGHQRFYSVGFSLNGKGYVGLGYGNSSYKDFWEYDPVLDKWTQLPDFPGEAKGRSGALGIGFRENCYVGMGTPNDLYVYNIISKSWSPAITQNCIKPRSGAYSFLVDNKFYYGAGSSADYNLWMYEIK